MEVGEPVRVEVLQRGKHGRRYWTDLDIQPLRDARGTLTGYVSVQTDITNQVERREYLDAHRREVVGDEAARALGGDAGVRAGGGRGRGPAGARVRDPERARAVDGRRPRPQPLAGR